MVIWWLWLLDASNTKLYIHTYIHLSIHTYSLWWERISACRYSTHCTDCFSYIDVHTHTHTHTHTTVQTNSGHVAACNCWMRSHYFGIFLPHARQRRHFSVSSRVDSWHDARWVRTQALEYASQPQTSCLYTLKRNVVHVRIKCKANLLNSCIHQKNTKPCKAKELVRWCAWRGHTNNRHWKPNSFIDNSNDKKLVTITRMPCTLMQTRWITVCSHTYPSLIWPECLEGLIDFCACMSTRVLQH
jgi:hypothetical protein